MARKPSLGFTKEELELLLGCKVYKRAFADISAPVTSTRRAPVTPARRAPDLRLWAQELNDSMKKARVENKEKYPHYVEDFQYTDNPLFHDLKKWVTRRIQSAAKTRERNTNDLPKGTASSGKGAAAGAAKANPKRNLEVLLEAAQAVDSESSSKRASETNPLGCSSKTACFGPK